MLEIQGVHASYGQIEAIHGVDLTIERGQIVSLIGANGAGKSTLLMTICGQPRASRGRIAFEGQEITNLETHDIAALGIAQVPEGRRIFSRMTVLENLQLGALRNDREYFQGDLAHVYKLFPRLKERESQRGGTLSGGEQQMLAIARALMGRPRLLLLDEPSLGLAPKLVQQIFSVIETINREGTTIFLVEQNAHRALALAHNAYVMTNGQIVLQGSGSELLANGEVRAAYLEGNNS